MQVATAPVASNRMQTRQQTTHERDTIERFQELLRDCPDNSDAISACSYDDVVMDTEEIWNPETYIDLSERVRDVMNSVWQRGAGWERFNTVWAETRYLIDNLDAYDIVDSGLPHHEIRSFLNWVDEWFAARYSL